MKNKRTIFVFSWLFLSRPTTFHNCCFSRIAFPSTHTCTSEHFSDDTYVWVPYSQWGPAWQQSWHAPEELDHTSLKAVDSTHSVSTDTPTRTSSNDFNQVEDFNLDLQSSKSHLTWTGHNSLKTFPILAFFFYRTPHGYHRPISAGSSLEDTTPPFPIIVY